MANDYDDIVITGAGLVSSLGLDRETTWNAIKAGRCGVGPLSAVESPLDLDKGGGQVADPDETNNKVPREVRLLRRAIAEALRDAGIESEGGRIELPCEPGRCAVLLGTTLHGMRNCGAFLRSGDYEHLKDFLAGATLRGAVDSLPGVGFTTTNCSACSSGLASVSLGHTLLQTGDADLVIAGGYDPISEYSYAGFNAMRLVSPTSLRPFAKTRDGMKVAEGYAIVVLERANDATKRHAKPLARIAGYGESCDAHHLSKPHPEGAGAVAAMRAALAMAGLQPHDIDMLIAHATATRDNDASEFRAMSQVFGNHLPSTPVVGLKRHLGHSLGAAGTIDLILGAMAIRDGVVPVPEDADSDHNRVEYDELRFDRHATRGRKLQHVLSTSLGFGGANACMIVSAPTAKPTEATSAAAAITTKATPIAAHHDVAITGVGVVLPGAIGAYALVELCRQETHPPLDQLGGSIPVEQYEHLLSARRTRRMSGYAKLCLAATTDAFANAGITDIPDFGETCAAIVGSTHGAAEYCHDYYRQLIDEGVNAANPLLFAEGVPNVASAHLTTTFSIKGFCQTLIGTRTAGLEALHLATARIRSGVWTRAVVCAADEHAELISDVYRSILGDAAFVDGSGAVAFILENRENAERRGATIRARVTKTFARSVDGCSARDAGAAIAKIVAALGALDELMLPGTTAPTDRLARVGTRTAHRHGTHPPRTATLYGRLPELFAVGPLAALAAMVCGKRLPTAPVAHFPENKNSQDADGHQPRQPFQRGGVLCGGLHGGFCAAVIELE